MVGSNLISLRGKVGSSPWRGIFDIIVTWHVFGYYGDTICGILGEKECRGESRDASTVKCQGNFFPRWVSHNTHPTTTMFAIARMKQ